MSEKFDVAIVYSMGMDSVRSFARNLCDEVARRPMKIEKEGRTYTEEVGPFLEAMRQSSLSFEDRQGPARKHLTNIDEMVDGVIFAVGQAHSGPFNNLVDPQFNRNDFLIHVKADPDVFREAVREVVLKHMRSEAPTDEEATDG